MSEVAVVGPAYTNEPHRYERLLNTARKFGVSVTLFGVGQEHPGDIGTINLGIQTLEGTGSKYVIVTDTYDTLFCRWDEKKVIEAIDAEPSGRLLACELPCWPPGPWSESYKARGPWSYLNGGQSCGRLEAICEMWRTAQRDYTMTSNPQERLHRMHADGYPMGLDTRCKIFQCMNTPVGSLIAMEHGAVRNPVSDSNPMMLHFNGSAPGFHEWYQRIMQ